jgi:multidrug resistance efflux pump
MSASFTCTLRSLEADGRPRRWVGLLLVALSGAGLAWSLLGQVTVYEVTDRAWLEVESAAHPLAAEVPGLVVQNDLLLGQKVRIGDVLVRQDSRDKELEIRQSETRRDALKASHKAVRLQIRAEEKTLEALKAVRDPARREYAAKADAANVRMRNAQDEAVRSAQLFQKR